MGQQQKSRNFLEILPLVTCEGSKEERYEEMEKNKIKKKMRE